MEAMSRWFFGGANWGSADNFVPGRMLTNWFWKAFHPMDVAKNDFALPKGGCFLFSGVKNLWVVYIQKYIRVWPLLGPNIILMDLKKSDNLWYRVTSVHAIASVKSTSIYLFLIDVSVAQILHRSRDFDRTKRSKIAKIISSKLN